MTYRGDDLDLRTPQTWVGGTAVGDPAAEPGAQSNGQRSDYRNGGPILVDDIVLASTNHAYDIALAHRSGEVRLEHLIYAMTRIDAAVDSLEGRGVRLAPLRRDVAAIVASEIPVGLPNGKGSPRRSDELAEVLRISSLNASRRNVPAGVDDVLSVLIDQRPDLTGASVLGRHVARLAVRETAEPLPPLSRYTSEPRYVRYEAPRYYVEQPRQYRPEAAATQTDIAQNGRIDVLEQMVRSLGSDLANERQVLSGLLKDLSRETQAQRDDQGRLQSGLFDRIQTLEQTFKGSGGASVSEDGLLLQLQNIETGLELRLQEMSQSWSVLSTRLQELEAAVRDRSGSMPADMKPIINRLDAIEEAVLTRPIADGGVTERFEALEAEISRALSANAASANRIETFISGFERTGNVEGAAVAFHANEAITKLSSDVGERLAAVERALAAEIETAAVKHQAYANDLGEVHDALMKLNQNQHTLAGSIDQWRTDQAGDVAMIANRLNGLDGGGRSSETLTKLNAHVDEMNRLLVERYHRRNRFWYWLFGTDDWIGSSWPSQRAAIEAEKTRVSDKA